MSMRLLGARTIKEVVPEMVDAGSIHQHIVAVPHDALYYTNCKSTQWVPLQGCDVDGFLDESLQSARLKDVKAKI